MAETLSLMEFLQALLTDAELRGSFGYDPQGTLADHGLADLTPADVHDALVLVQDNQTIDFTSDAAGVPPPPPPPLADDGHEAAVEYLARYLADPQQVDQQQAGADDDLWGDVDSDVAVAATPVPGPDVLPSGPDSSFRAGGADAYGSGTSSWLGGTDAPDAYDDLRDLGDYDDLAADDLAADAATPHDVATLTAGDLDPDDLRALEPGGDDPNTAAAGPGRGEHPRDDLPDGI